MSSSPGVAVMTAFQDRALETDAVITFSKVSNRPTLSEFNTANFGHVDSVLAAGSVAESCSDASGKKLGLQLSWQRVVYTYPLAEKWSIQRLRVAFLCPISSHSCRRESGAERHAPAFVF